MKNKEEIINAVRMLTHTAIEFIYKDTNITMENFGEKTDELCGQQEHILLLLADNSENELEPDAEELAKFILELIENEIGGICDIERAALINDLTHGNFKFVKKQIEQIKQENIARGLIRKENLSIFSKQDNQVTNNITVEFIVDPRSYEATREPIKTYKSTNHFNNKNITVITDTTDNILKLIQKFQYYYYFKKLDERNNSGAEFAPCLENTKNGRLFVCTNKEVEKLKQLVLSASPNTRIEIEHYCMEM